MSPCLGLGTNPISIVLLLKQRNASGKKKSFIKFFSFSIKPIYNGMTEIIAAINTFIWVVNLRNDLRSTFFCIRFSKQTTRWNSAVAEPIVAPNLGISVYRPCHTADGFLVVKAIRISLIAPLLSAFRMNDSMHRVKHYLNESVSQHALTYILSSSVGKALFLKSFTISLRLLENFLTGLFLICTKSSYGLVQCASIWVIWNYKSYLSSSILSRLNILLRDVDTIYFLHY